MEGGGGGIGLMAASFSVPHHNQAYRGHEIPIIPWHIGDFQIPSETDQEREGIFQIRLADFGDRDFGSSFVWSNFGD